MIRGFSDILLIIPNKYKTFNHRKLSLYLFLKNCTIHAFRAPCPTFIYATEVLVFRFLQLDFIIRTI